MSQKAVVHLGYARITLLAVPSAFIGSLIGSLVLALVQGFGGLPFVLLFAFVTSLPVTLISCLAVGAPLVFAMREPLYRHPLLFGPILILVAVWFGVVFIAPVLGGWLDGAPLIFSASCAASYFHLYRREVSLTASE